MGRRSFLKTIAEAAFVSSTLLLAKPRALLAGQQPATKGAPGTGPAPLGYSIHEIAEQAGLDFLQVSGGNKAKKYIVETTGAGVAFFDYDQDGWLDIFLLNSATLDAPPVGTAPGNKLFHNNRDGTFTDVTEQARLAHTGWGQGVCVGDFNNDGFDDLYVTYWGENLLYRNNGDGTFTEVGRQAHVAGSPQRWSTGCAFVDYDRDGWLDLVVTHYVDFSLSDAKDPGSNPYCTYRGLPVMCGPRGLKSERTMLYRNNRDGTFTDVSRQSGIGAKEGTFGMGVVVADFDNDGWPDIYIASDSTPSVLFMNNQDGTFREEGLLRGVAYSREGREEAGMGVAVGDYDGDGWLDLLKTNFSDESPNLFHNDGKALFTDVAAQAGVNRQTHFVGWGCGFFDPDNDGLLDILYCNGHVYPELDRIHADTAYRQPRVLYRNLGAGLFEDVTAQAGDALTSLGTGRGCAFGDFNNDGSVGVVINNQGGAPSLLQFKQQNAHHWISIKLRGVTSNRSAIGARVRCVAGTLSQIDEVRSGGSYLSQSDLRLHFGLRDQSVIDLLEIHWPSGVVDRMEHVRANQFLHVAEGSTRAAATSTSRAKE
ncbi:CRTAC1 family protein [Acidipila sp. EB88]|nr:CRTAC1 family protein [Acidipila sp. EB88]